MTTDSESSNLREPLLTLEPVIEAVREGVEGAGWTLSGLQKTTSHEFEGRWAGDSSRSAYLFFHHPRVEDDVSIDVYLDEGRRGISGNLALVVDGRDLGELRSVPSLLERLGAEARDRLLEGYAIPATFRVRIDPRGEDPVRRGVTEIRFKVRIPGRALKAGRSAVAALSTAAVVAFESLLGSPEVEAFRLPPEEPEA